MCGIAGVVSRERVDPGALDRPLTALALRGPDGCRTWLSPRGNALLGHRRLAILDTSSRGEEPSVGQDGRSGFIHNGEIYNFQELRGRLEEEGERFSSESDGEVAHRLLRREGLAGLGRLEGMFALALWREDSGTLLLARDRLGIKPLYYAAVPGGLAFASQPKALLTLPSVSARLDPEALSDFLSYGYVPFDRSILFRHPEAAARAPPPLRAGDGPPRGRTVLAPRTGSRRRPRRRRGVARTDRAGGVLAHGLRRPGRRLPLRRARLVDRRLARGRGKRAASRPSRSPTGTAIRTTSATPVSRRRRSERLTRRSCSTSATCPRRSTARPRSTTSRFTTRPRWRCWSFRGWHAERSRSS